MAKIYTKNTWANEVLAGDEKYTIEEGGVQTHADAVIALKTEVVTAGTPVNAEKMNNIEEGIDGLDTKLNSTGADILKETSASLSIGGVADGTLLRREGTSLVGKTVAEMQTLLGVQTKHIRGFVSNPQAVYAQRAQIVLIRTESAITITRIHIHCADTSPTAELAGDLKFADDVNAGGFANATIIDVCDTTNGVKTITSGFDDATVPAGKYVYFQLDSSPHADIKDFYIEVYYTVD